jgi:hypothetical protein
MHVVIAQKQTVELLKRRSGPGVEHALVLAWQTLNRICPKRLIPFLPTLLDSLYQACRELGQAEVLRMWLQITARKG